MQQPYIFLFFRYLKNYTFKKTNTGFSVIPSTIYLHKISNRRWCLLGLRLVKKLVFSYKRANFSVTVKILFNQNIMTPCYSNFFYALFIFSGPFKSNWILSFLLYMISIKKCLKIQTFSNLPISRWKRSIIIL